MGANLPDEVFSVSRHTDHLEVRVLEHVYHALADERLILSHHDS
jgi:hypothetical protein